MTGKNRQNSKTILYMALPVALAAAVFAFFACRIRRTADGGPEQILIAVPYSEWVQDYETNYFTRWLEEKTGYDLSFVYLDEGYEGESLNKMLTSGNRGVDAVFLPTRQEILSFGEYYDYIEGGYLAAPGDYLPPDSCLSGVTEAYPEVNFERLLGADGREYCFPSVNMARAGRNLQILWINVDWLTNLNLTMPRTTEEFREVLLSFREKDPNGNGVADEIPLVSCEAETSFRSYLYLLNSYLYYDEGQLSWHVEDGAVVAGVEREAFRRGLSYCAALYRDGLLNGDCFSYTKKQLMELVNDPADTVGAFASRSIADVVYTNNPGILAHFVQLAPLSSDVLEAGYAVRAGIFPSIGGLIPANATHKEAAARIMDLMLSEEASLIALYGEENVDWRFSKDGELSTYGTRARVTTIRYLKGERQNKNYVGAGPLVAAAANTDGVTWNGDHSMTEYIDARAVKTYETSYHIYSDAEREALNRAFSSLKPAERRDVLSYLESEIPRFIRGDRDVEDDGDWERFLMEYRRLAGI